MLTRILGLVVAVVGAGLLLIGLNATGSVFEQTREALTGQHSQATILYILGGAAALVGGGALVLAGRSSDA